MGRQINFYMGEQSKKDFIHFLIEQGYIFLADGICEDIEHIKPSCVILETSVCLYKKVYGSIKLNKKTYSNFKYINKSYNPIIEYWRSSINNDKKCIKSGRLWISSYDFYDSNTDRTIISNDYNNLVKWVKNRIPYRKVDGYSLKMYIDDEILELINKGYKLK